MDLYDILLAKNLSGSGGGGGDFSTAQVTVTVVNGDQIAVSGGIIQITSGEMIPQYHFENGTNTLVLYQGQTTFSFTSAEPITTYSGAIELGEAEQDGGEYYTEAVVTGNCAVTVKAVDIL